MGSRAVVVVCRDEEAARERFGVAIEASSASSTPAPAGGSSTTAALEARVPRPGARRPDRRRLLGASSTRLGLPRLRTDAVVGQGPGTAARPSTRRSGSAGAAVAAPRPCRRWSRPAGRLDGETRGELEPESTTPTAAQQDIGRFVAAYRQYCWPVESLTDLKLAPFHLLATEGHVHTDKDHRWHMETLAEVCRADPSCCWRPRTRSWT